MATKKNIIVGAARVFLGPALNTPDGATNAEIATAIVDEWRPVTTAAQAFNPASHTYTVGTPYEGDTWKDVGYTQDGLEVATDPSWGEVEVDQLLDAAKIFKDGMGFSISTTFAEATLENLLIAWGQAEEAATVDFGEEIDIDGGALGEAPFERGLIAIGNAVEVADGNAYGERTYFAYRVLSVDASTHSLSRAEATTIPVSFRALPADNGKYGSVRDRLGIAAEVAPAPFVVQAGDGKTTDEPTLAARKAGEESAKSESKKKS